MNHRHSNSARQINTVIFAVVSILLAIGFYFFPLISDDLMSVDYQLDAFRNGAPFDFKAYDANISEIFCNNHFRLPNILMPPIILLPRIVPAVISGIAIYMILVQALALTDCRTSFSAAAWLVVAVVFLLPWVDQLYLISFQAPYLWGAAMALWLIRHIIKQRGHNFLIFAMSWLTGFWMEAYGGAILGGVICLAVFYRTYRTRLVYWSMAGLVLGILTCASPLLIFGALPYWPFFEGRAVMVFSFVIINIIYLIAYACLLLRHRREIVRPLDLLLLEIAVASLILTIFFNAGARINCLGTIVSAIGICRLAGVLHLGDKSRKAVSLIAALALAVSAVHVVAVDCMCYRLGSETDYVVQHCRRSEGASVFAPMTFREDVPWYLLQKPYYDWFSHTRTREVFQHIYGFSVNAVPDVLRDFKSEDAQVVDGTAAIYRHRGQLVAPSGCGDEFMVDYGRGINLRKFCVTSFVGADSVDYVWLHPDNTWMDFMLHPDPVRMDVPSY